jgi:hypothetical protein
MQIPLKLLLRIITVLLTAHVSHAQDSIASKSSIVINGYIKNLQIIDINKGSNKPHWNSIVHNRINAKWIINGRYTAVGEVRNQIFFGEDIRKTGKFSESLRNRNEFVNLQTAWIENNSIVFHTNVERLYLDYKDKDISIRAGRQRINWGITTIWNPNDIFNTYNFLDFDYEERPGSDGVKLYYKISNSLTAEGAYANTGNSEGGIAAVKLLFNKWNYDLQFISGYYKKDLTLGFGWAGYLKSAGFKGEAQYFNKAGGLLNLSLEGDYMFKNGWYLNTGVLLNDHGVTDDLLEVYTMDFNVSPEQLMPTRWTTICTIAKEINPLWTLNTSLVYSPRTNLFIFYPSLQCNVMPDFDLNLVLQSFFAETSHTFTNISNVGFIRMQWSF